ncbi:hypothetical protein LCGC14_0563370 [marine sediment metagenome]|uniref:Uncharacterized protein n=1 Tax=marine sediment metagenome TaxID=412755 RepID=A0A0F9RRL6_9ZZZZ|nr:MAG: hypothetical protein Lokiarch_50360 [Candidatus Lokiarchaeum sp. GC14_75]HEA70386.1 hypothetical protein [archaeon]
MESKQNLKRIELIKNISISNYEFLREILGRLNKIFEGQRAVMYSDIINLIVKEGKIGEKYNEIMLWCNYKIRQGKTFVEV